MPKKPKTPVIVEESESESELSIKSELNGNDNSDSEISDIEPDSVSSNSTKIEVTETTGIEAKLELVKALRNTSWAPLRYSYAAKKVDWTKVDMKGYSHGELQNMLKEIINQAGYIRTLNEVLDDYEKNYVKMSRKAHPDFPSQPPNPLLRYMQENREKLEQEYSAKEGQVPVYFQLFKYGAEKFKNLPDKKKEKYIKAYKQGRDEFNEKKKEFFVKHPELKTKKPSKERASRPNKTFNDYPVLTPFLFYWMEMCKKEKVPMRATQLAWKALSAKEKGKYIDQLAKFETDKEKKITKAEWSLVEKMDGFPGRPMNLHNLFMKKYHAEHKGSSKLFVEASKVWSQITEGEKAKLQKELDKINEQWKEEMEIWIRKQPADKQPGLFAKHNLNKKRRADTTMTQETPQKKTKKDTEKSPEKKTEKKLFSSSSSDSEEEVERSPKKDKQRLDRSPFKAEKQDRPVIIETTLGSSSPKKEKSKKLKEPEYPSQTTAHYFMTKIYEGKPAKIAKAYRKLDPMEKKKYREEVNSKKKSFLIVGGNYIKKLESSEASKYQMKMKELKAQQADSTHWHTSTGTDDEKKAPESSSDDDSDSS